jgi:S-adenosyl-L-methionine hydrolase (adenosine-forming)
VLITFLTDFGLEDDFVGICHGVMKRISPEVEIIDITHGIQPHEVLQGSIMLANTLPYFPVGVHLAVVDPGVGSQRRSVALRSGDGRLYVGPDNGLLVPAAEKLGGIEAAHEITNRDYALEPISATFHGRDIFSPAAAHLAQGLALEELGPAVEPDSLARIQIPEPEISERRIRACCLYVDRFGNMQLNLTREHVMQFGIEPGTQVELELATERYYAIAARTFTDARGGEIILYEDAYENIAIAISGGSAAETLSAEPGADVRIRLAHH